MIELDYILFKLSNCGARLVPIVLLILYCALGFSNFPSSTSSAAAAQNQNQPPLHGAISTDVEVRLVQIEVRVRDRSGHAVTDLRREDFSLRDNGRRQVIHSAGYISMPSVVSQSHHTGETLPTTSMGETSPSPPSWIYIMPEFGNPTQFMRAGPAIREFVDKHLLPGMRMSIAGLPFTDNKSLLLTMLDRLLKGPYGEGAKMPPAISSDLANLEDLELQRELAEEIRRQNHELIPLSDFGRDPMFSGRPDQVRYFTIERLDRLIPFYGQLALMRYRDLIERLKSFPGKKSIVLFRPGLRLDKDNADLLDQVAALALRNRVSFYAMDPKGLDPILPDDQKRRSTFVWEASGLNYPDQDIMRSQALAAEARAGLTALAESTGGKAVTNTNDMGQILDVVLKESYGYYLLEYYPDDLSAQGRYRRVDVSVSRPGVKVDAVRGYSEPAPAERLSKGDRRLDLYRELVSDQHHDFPLEASLKVFADAERNPLLIYCVGLRPQDLTPAKRKDEVFLNLAALSRTGGTNIAQMSDYQEDNLEYRVPVDRWAKISSDSTAAVTLNSTMPAWPGVYAWKIAVREQSSGRIGAVELNIEIPDFRSSSTPSSLILTRGAVQLKNIPVSKTPGPEAGGPAKDPLQVLDAGPLRYYPQHANRFRQGDTIFLLYHLYNPTTADWESAAQGMQIALYNDGMPVTDVSAGGQPYPDRKERLIRFTAFLDTKNLQPGTYALRAYLPNHQTRDTPYLEEGFSLVAAGAQK